MSDLSTFVFNQNYVRVLNIEGEPWFVAKDLCKILEIKNIGDGLSRLDDDEKFEITGDLLIGLTDNQKIRRLVGVSESGMYTLVLTSRKPQAKPFRKWITSEVLPSIRKTGKYEMEQKPKSAIELFEYALNCVKEHEQRLQQLEQIQKEQEEYIEAVGELAEANSQELTRFKNGHGYWYSIVGYCKKHEIGDYSRRKAATWGKRATAFRKKSGIVPEKINDAKYGSVNVYPENILDEIILV